MNREQKIKKILGESEHYIALEHILNFICDSCFNSVYTEFLEENKKVIK